MTSKEPLWQRYSKLKSGYKVAICFAIIIVLSILYQIVAFNRTSSLYVQEVLFILVPILIWKFGEKKPLYKMGFTSGKESLRHFIIGLILGAISMSIVFIMLLAVGNVSILGNILKPNLNAKLLSDLVLFIMVGFAEETFFRGYCLKSISERNGNLKAIIISSVLFSVVHSLNPNVAPLFFVNVVLVGILFSYMALKFSIWFSIGFHAMWDYFEGNIWGLPDSGIVVKGMYSVKFIKNNIINGGLVGPEGGLVVTLVLLVCILIVLGVKQGKNFCAY
ncbi:MULTISPECIES: CPBP family intramembrane glutamic endopeptidase [Clostridium]|uniref:CPBP family intramembrane glutamic endopeptidase n=1 Tax=Clostridium TaxID=1485 RepID=UPI000824866F|nr:MULTISPECIES: type II CAAX endopeptidase family protein [Clostridium]PJI07927.1 CPBP family intramembrane metalloprotease [Clostridium sp. CT7]